MRFISSAFPAMGFSLQPSIDSGGTAGFLVSSFLTYVPSQAGLGGQGSASVVLLPAAQAGSLAFSGSWPLAQRLSVTTWSAGRLFSGSFCRGGVDGRCLVSSLWIMILGQFIGGTLPGPARCPRDAACFLGTVWEWGPLWVAQAGSGQALQGEEPS